MTKSKYLIAVLVLIAAAAGYLSIDLKGNDMARDKLPKNMNFIYRDEYNIKLPDFQHLHMFDAEKYGKIFNYLREELGVEEHFFVKPEIIKKSDLLKVHSEKYLDSLSSSRTIAKIAEVRALCSVPVETLSKNILTPMKYAVSGTVKGAKIAIEKGWAINLSGGYHHAKREKGSGFCFFADIPLAVKMIHEKTPDSKIFIIDLDAHQGNGIESIIKRDRRVAIFDLYNLYIFPKDGRAARHIDYDYPVPSGIKDDKYLEIVEKRVGEAIEKENPDLIIYNAGSDILDGDMLGLMSVSEKGVIKRDEIVFEESMKRGIPILMVLSGGYTRRSADVISKSIENLLINVIKKYEN